MMDQKIIDAVNQAVDQKLSKVLEKVSKINEIEQSLISLSDFYDTLKKKVSKMGNLPICFSSFFYSSKAKT